MRRFPVKYKVTHTTKYDYDTPVPVCHNIVYLTPRNTELQSCSRHRLTVNPTPATNSKRTDYFGNAVTTFSVANSHRLLQITATSTVVVTPRDLPVADSTMAWEQVRDHLAMDRSAEGLAAYQFAFASPYVPFHPELGEYARRSFVPGRPILAAIRELNTRLHTDVKYDPKATTVSTPIMEVFEHRRGVCQDLAHLMLGCLRTLGLAARYVSGYLRTQPPAGKPRLVGADASHAWISVYGGKAGWIDVDPTNDSFPQSEHITIAWGRDFSDVCPVAGMFIGGGSHKLSVAVDVAPVE
jgi:transglutaminase-like putative cysteine protease